MNAPIWCAVAIQMLRTLIKRLRIIAPLIISTFYNSLWSDSRSGHFTQLYTYAPHEYQISSQLVIFETSYVCFYAKKLTPFISF